MAKSEQGRKQRLTVFLIKEGFEKIADFLSIDGLITLPIENNGEFMGTLAYRGGFVSKPSWVGIFSGVPGFDQSQILNQGSKALFTLKHENRWFCFTFGASRHLIENQAVEKNFGLIVTLNLGDPNAIKSIDKTNISHISLHSKEQATREIELAEFEFNNDIDLLKSVTAKTPVDSSDEQETLSGRDSVSIYTHVSLETFPEIAERLFFAYQSKKYKERYPWIDKIVEERDKSVVEALDNKMVDGIVNHEFSKIWLAVPELVEWEKLDGFSYTQKGVNWKKAGPVTHPDLSIEPWTHEASISGSLTTKILHAKRIHAIWLDGTATSWSVYRCLNAELDHEGKKYVLNDGDWYNIDTGFVEDVNKFYSQVPDTAVSMPPFGTMKEPAYLIDAAVQLEDFTLMDRKLIKIGGGHSTVEFCDLYSKSTKLIMHVKYYGGSSLLSHLFNQAFVSGECFLHETDFRVQVNEKLPENFKLDDPSNPPMPQEYEVCVAIMSKYPGPLELPFFSKVSFRQTVKSLRQLGYRVSKLKIQQN